MVEVRDIGKVNMEEIHSVHWFHTLYLVMSFVKSQVDDSR